MKQLEITDFYCSKADFYDWHYHCRRLWSSTLFLFKIKVFKLMYHFARAQTHLENDHFPDDWHAFGASLPRSHVLNEQTFELIMRNRVLTVAELQQTGYQQPTLEEIEHFDQASLQEFLDATFSFEELLMAQSQVR